MQSSRLEKHIGSLTAVEFSKVSLPLMGNRIGLVPAIKTMAIPTTLLVDEHGRIRWIDQADDYRVRGDESRTRDALASVFDSARTAA